MKVFFESIKKFFFCFFILLKPLVNYRNLRHKILISHKNPGVLKCISLNKLQDN